MHCFIVKRDSPFPAQSNRSFIHFKLSRTLSLLWLRLFSFVAAFTLTSDSDHCLWCELVFYLPIFTLFSVYYRQVRPWPFHFARCIMYGVKWTCRSVFSVIFAAVRSKMMLMYGVLRTLYQVPVGVTGYRVISILYLVRDTSFIRTVLCPKVYYTAKRWDKMGNWSLRPSFQKTPALTLIVLRI